MKTDIDPGRSAESSTEAVGKQSLAVDVERVVVAPVRPTRLLEGVARAPLTLIIAERRALRLQAVQAVGLGGY